MALKKYERFLITLMILLSAFHFNQGFKVLAREKNHEHSYTIFQEDFEDEEAEDWYKDIPDEAPLGSSWTIELDDGNYVLCGRGQAWAEAGDFSWTNYTLEAKVKILSIPSGGHISFRMMRGSRYFVQFWSNDMFITKEYMGNFTEVVHTSVLLNPNKWYNFKVVCVGNSISVYLDDTLKMEYIDNDEPLLYGRIGLESCPESQIYFDNVKVCTTHRLYVANLIGEARDEIDEARMLGADTVEAEERLTEAETAFQEGDLSDAENLAEEAANLAEHAYVGPVSVSELSKYSTEYDQRTVEVSGTIRDIRYEEGVYSFAVDDGTGVVSAKFDGSLGEIKIEDKVRVIGVFDASEETLAAEGLEKLGAPSEGLYTFLIFKDDFEDGDYSDWRIDVDPEIEGSSWEVVREDDSYVLSGEGHGNCMAGDSDWTDYILEFRIKLVKGMAFINFRVTWKPEVPDRYTLRLFSSHMALLKGERYPDERHFTELKKVSVELGPDAWYEIMIFCLGDNIRVYLDDNLKLDYTDEESPFLSGSMGLEPVSYDNGKPSNVLFDDVKVSKMATTGDISDLIDYAQTEIDEAREINADVSSAELKLEQARQALAQENYQIVQYMVDEAVWLAKRSSIGQVAIKDLRAMATLCNGHLVTITGTVRDLESQYGTGYNFNIDDGTGGLRVTYQGVLVDIGDGYEVRVTGIFDASTENVAASKIEKISGPPETDETGPFGITWNLETITTLITISGAAIGVVGWFVRHETMEKRRKVLFTKLLDEVDAIYSRFKMNAVQCESELYKLKDEVLEEFKEGMIDEDKHNILEQKIDKYLKEVREQIEEKSQ